MFLTDTPQLVNISSFTGIYHLHIITTWLERTMCFTLANNVPLTDCANAVAVDVLEAHIICSDALLAPPTMQRRQGNLQDKRTKSSTIKLALHRWLSHSKDTESVKLFNSRFFKVDGIRLRFFEVWIISWCVCAFSLYNTIARLTLDK